jgi:hypothetical protein
MESHLLLGHSGIDFNAAAHRAVRQRDLDRDPGAIFVRSDRHVCLTEFLRQLALQIGHSLGRDV